jgi:Right handed beta helix region
MRGFQAFLAATLVAGLVSSPASATAQPAQSGGSHHKRQHRAHRGKHRNRRVRAHAATVGRSPLAASISGTTYYVSPSGSDSNSGSSPSQAWRTVGRVNNAKLRPGDRVLFQGGHSFGGGTLMPESSGAPGAPIVYGSYGNGQATVTHGVWFVDTDYLTFDDLTLGPDGGLQGGNSSGHAANHIVVQRSTIDLAPGNSDLGINANGDDWTIADNTVENTGDSGMLLIGERYRVRGNTITNTGLDSAIGYGKHGIYLKVANATIAGNTITHFSADGISARYRDSTITGNAISHGPIGIGFFQYDTVPGTSHWNHNTITNTTAAGIFVSSSDKAGPTIESFVIRGNTIQSSGQRVNVQDSRGRVMMTGNRA